MGDTFAAPRDADSLAEIVNMIGRLDRREGAREIVRRMAARAGVELSPAACWLLAKLSEDAPGSLEALAERASVATATLVAARDRLLDQGLIILRPGAGETPLRRADRSWEPPLIGGPPQIEAPPTS